jgi:hypothetical protein
LPNEWGDEVLEQRLFVRSGVRPAASPRARLDGIGARAAGVNYAVSLIRRRGLMRLPDFYRLQT